jgi:hypothetical protein
MSAFFIFLCIFYFFLIFFPHRSSVRNCQTSRLAAVHPPDRRTVRRPRLALPPPSASADLPGSRRGELLPARRLLPPALPPPLPPAGPSPLEAALPRDLLPKGTDACPAALHFLRHGGVQAAGWHLWWPSE